MILMKINCFYIITTISLYFVYIIVVKKNCKSIKVDDINVVIDFNSEINQNWTNGGIFVPV